MTAWRWTGTHLAQYVVLVISSIVVVSAMTFGQDVQPLGSSTVIALQPVVAPPTTVVAEDHNFDNAGRIDLFWVPSIDEKLQGSLITGYRVYRLSGDGPAVPVADLPPGSTSYADNAVAADSSYSYYVASLTAGAEFPSIRTQALRPETEWFDGDRIYLLLITLTVSAAVILFVEAAKRGRKLFVRRIAGLEAIDEAVGRATEMGRPVLFIPGIHDMDDPQTLAALNILGRVARTIADYDTKVYMPVSRSLVMTAGRETIKAAYQAAGRPDAYSDDMVAYVTDEQFGYVAAVDGIMVRERPATVFLLGTFFAESLILAETGNSVGAIQIAGTARPAQLPFFVAACDFTLIGEELFAASAYLSGEPRQLGSLKGQDMGKLIALLAVVVGAIAATMAQAWQVEVGEQVFDWLSRVFSAN